LSCTRGATARQKENPPLLPGRLNQLNSTAGEIGTHSGPGESNLSRDSSRPVLMA